MNKKICFLSLCCLFSLLFISCEETSEADKYANWRERNEAFIDSLDLAEKTDPELHYYTDTRINTQKIFYKKIEEATDTEAQSPFSNSKVKVFYRGMLINEDVFDSNFSGANPTEFDTPSIFTVNALISGWIEILQHMRPGDRWKLYIPWKSAYGDEESGSIPAYSTLIFDLMLVEVTEP